MQIVKNNLGRDATRAFFVAGLQTEAACLSEFFTIASVDRQSDGCLTASVVVYISLIIILAVVLARFVLAMYFTYVIGWRLGNSKAHERAMEDLRRRRAEYGRNGSSMPNLNYRSNIRDSMISTSTGVVDIPLEGISRLNNQTRRMEAIRSAVTVSDPSRSWNASFGFMDMSVPNDPETERILNDPTLLHTLVMVPCYSEGVSSLKATLNSVAHSYYPSTHKCLFVIADGIVKGAENTQTTPDILIDMIEVDERFRKEDPKWGGEPESYSYVAIADGANRKNYAKVYAGWYKYDLSEKPTAKDPLNKRHNTNNGKDTDGAQLKTLRKRAEGRIPMLLIVKVGNEEERNPAKPAKKPGNRGKRDSQVILMNFLSKVMFDDRMTELEFDIFFKLFTITGVNPEKYEAVLMVDADTRIYPDSLSHMVACLLRDDSVMGLCGETKISNKWDSWVTMIQVNIIYIYIDTFLICLY